MHAGWLGQPDFLDGVVKGFLKTTLSHWSGVGLRVATGIRAGKQPDRVAMGAPVLAQQAQGLGRERDIAVLVAFSALNVELHPRAVDLGDAQLNAFEQA